MGAVGQTSLLGLVRRLPWTSPLAGQAREDCAGADAELTSVIGAAEQTLTAGVRDHSRVVRAALERRNDDTNPVSLPCRSGSGSQLTVCRYATTQHQGVQLLFTRC